jgi:hypothetical protein
LHTLVRESKRPDVLQDLVWPAQTGLPEELDFLFVDLLHERDLDCTCMEGVKVVQDRVDIQIREVLSFRVNDVPEVLSESFSGAEGGKLLARGASGLQEWQVQASAADVIGKPLDALLWPSLDALEELPLVLVVEVLDAPLELDLGSAQRVDLLEFLQVEESLRD